MEDSTFVSTIRIKLQIAFHSIKIIPVYPGSMNHQDKKLKCEIATPKAGEFEM
jgi:hypothetical protein